MDRRILFLLPEDGLFRAHYLARARGAKANGWEVHVAVKINDPETPASMHAEGFQLHPLRNYPRGRISPFATARTVMDLCVLLRHVRPGLIHQGTLQLVLCGALAALLAWRYAGVVNGITGLGNVFSQNRPLLRLLRPGVLLALRMLFASRRMWLLTENRDDADFLARKAGIHRERICVIDGAGVDCAAFVPLPEPDAPDGSVIVSLVARMLWSKGIDETVNAARRLRERGAKVLIRLVGRSDTENPLAVPDAMLRGWHAEGVVECPGFQRDVLRVWRESHIALLPSHGGEGLPRCLLEAGACARPLVTTDVPGCRDLVRDGKEGCVVTAGDVDGLADAIEKLALDGELRRRMGENARRRIVEFYSDEAVVSSTLDLYRRVLRRNSR